MNIDKTELFALGKNKIHNIPGKFRNLLKTEVKILGITITNEINTTSDINYKQALQTMKGLVDIWKNRKMLLSGKISIIKSLIT